MAKFAFEPRFLARLKERRDRAGPRLDQLLRHPLTALVVGFLLTGLVGSWLTSMYAEKSRERDRTLAEDRAQFDLSLKSIDDFTTLLYARRTRAAMLYSSFVRDAPPDEIKQRKHDYDEAFAAWNSRLQATLFTIRRAVKAAEYSYFENLVETRLVPPFRALDSCLTRMYDERIAARKAPPDSCDPPKLLQVTLDCSYAVSDELLKFVVFDRLISGADREARMQKAAQEITQRCAV